MSGGGAAVSRADWLYDWLLARDDAVLPPLGRIAQASPETFRLRERGMRLAASLVANAFRDLARQGRIEQRHGTLQGSRGHRIVLIVETGTVLQTPGCPLTLRSPPNLAGTTLAAQTKRTVLAVVEGHARRGEPLPTDEALAQRLGLSQGTVYRCLAALRDDGRIGLARHGKRRVAELPDGRRTA